MLLQAGNEFIRELALIFAGSVSVRNQVMKIWRLAILAYRKRLPQIGRLLIYAGCWFKVQGRRFKQETSWSGRMWLILNGIHFLVKAVCDVVRLGIRPTRPEGWLALAATFLKWKHLRLTELACLRAIALAPASRGLEIYRVISLIRQDRFVEANVCLNAALMGYPSACPTRDLLHLQMTITDLADEQSDRGQREEAKKKYRLAMSMDVDSLDAYCHIWTMLVSRGEFEDAQIHYQRTRSIQAGLQARRAGASQNARYLRQLWCQQIGHLAHLDGYLKIGLMGWRPEKRIVMLAPSRAISNEFFLRLWERYVTVISDPHEIALLEEDARAAEDYLPMHDIFGKGLWAPIAGATVQKAWEDKGRGSLLKLDDDTINRGWENLERMGVPHGAWFVGLHVRDSGYHGGREGDSQSSRDSDVRTYLPAIGAIVRRGGWVIRMGDRSAAPLPSVPGLVDYAHSSWRSDWMDIFLCAMSRFYIGTQSGLGFVPPVFGVPTVMTNWISLALPFWYGNGVFIPKLLYSEPEKRILSFSEILSTNLGYTQVGLDFARRQIRWVNNSPEDIRKVVEEMMDRIDNTRIAQNEVLQEEWVNLAQRAHVVVGNSRMGDSFLKDHPELIESERCDLQALNARRCAA